MSRYMDTQKAIDGVVNQMDVLNAEIDSLQEIKYAPPAIEVIDGVMSDKSQDADWLRARYFEGQGRIQLIEDELSKLRRVASAAGDMNEIRPPPFAPSNVKALFDRLRDALIEMKG